MGSHPINLAFRFLLEITALLSVGLWGWRQQDGWLRYLLAIMIPVILAAIWGTFTVPDDPSRSGSAPIVTPGLTRLILELAIFAVAVWSLYHMNYGKAGLIFAILVILHYIASYDRIIWLLSK